jgi:hypothetical protein
MDKPDGRDGESDGMRKTWREMQNTEPIGAGAARQLG